MPRRTRFQKIRQSRSFLLFVLTIVVLAILAIVKKGFIDFNSGNLTIITMELSYYGLYVTAMACLLMSGGFDFSLASQGTLITLIFVQLCVDNQNVSWIVFAIVIVVIGAAMGALNAFLSQVLNLMPFICTIAMSTVWIGIANWWTGGLVKTLNNESLISVGTARVFGSPVPWTFVFMIAVFVIYSMMFKYTRFGRSVLIVGGNPVAARLAGLNPKKIKAILYVNASFLGALAGLVYTAQNRTANVTGLPQRMPEMRGLTSSMLGGVSFMGGSGALTGAFFGILLTQVLANAMTTMGLPAWIVQFTNGMLLVIALTIDTMSTRLRLRRLGLKASGGGGSFMMPGMSR